MKKIMIASAIVAAMSCSAAVAGGYTAPAVVAEPVAAPAVEKFNWSGAYAGVTAGKTGTKLSFDGVDDFGNSVSNKIDDDATSYGVFAGYRHQYSNRVVAGVEANYAKTENFFDLDGTEVWGFEAQAGYAFDRILPYAAVGYGKAWGEDALSLSVGVDYALTDNVIAGIKYTRTDIGDFDVANGKFDVDVDTVALRIGYTF